MSKYSHLKNFGVLILCFLFVCSSLGFAGQTINIDEAVTHNVYGNGEAGNGGNWDGSDYGELKDPNGNTVNVSSDARGNLEA